MKYSLSIPDPSSKFIEIEMYVENISADKVYFQLSSWRPGRYELGNFAKNIQKWNAFDENENVLKYKKVTKDKWEVETKKISKVILRYNYFASQLDAGGCWLDTEQLYVNPVHCFLYVEERKNEACEIELNIPDGWKVAVAAEKISKKKLLVKNFDVLADTPFIASPNLKHHSYEVSGKIFHIWMQGECKPDFIRIENDFKKFTESQIKMMGDFPSEDYHFLVQVLPYNFYHGVEHAASTVLAIGPGFELMNENVYNEFVGVASHELFHVWNVKNIRPAEMLPYDYTKENYSRLGYVYEGFTTYYGDLFLARTGFFTREKYLAEISVQFQKHQDNYGRFNYSVAQSSFDTWLDGYVPGVPGRKTSIYTEGFFIALMLDFMIRKSTSGKKSLDDVMRKLYFDFGKQHIGYTENDIVKTVEFIADRPFTDFFENYVYKPVSYDSLLSELLSYAGLEIRKSLSPKSYERMFGFKTEQAGGVNKISAILPASPAAFSDLAKGDEIISVNSFKAENNLNELFHYFEKDEITLHVFSSKKLKTVTLKASAKTFCDSYEINVMDKISPGEEAFLKAWCA
ncbi:MAG TPA: M61 family peptidase [Bacteroidia bacterium]|nr:M61 family peptidase [Bacteroidia bacterium]